MQLELDMQKREHLEKQIERMTHELDRMSHEAPWASDMTNNRLTFYMIGEK
jgi:hypothetical protein